MRYILLFIYLLFLLELVNAQQNEKLDSLNAFLNEKPIEEHAKIYNDLFWFYWDEGNISQAIINAQKAFDVADKFDNQLEQYYALMNVMSGNMELELADSAINAGLLGLEMARTLNDPTFIARTHNQLGLVYVKISLFDKALEHYLSSLSIIEDTLPNTSPENNLKYKAMVINNIGSIYMKMNNTPKAMDFYMQALEIRRKLNQPGHLASSLQNVGLIYENTGEYDKALKYYEEALEIRESLGKKDDIAELLLNIGVIYHIKDQYKLSEQNLLESINIFRENENQRHMAHAHFAIVRLYFEMDQYESAHPYIIEGLEVALKVQDLIYESEAYELLSEYFAANNNYLKAFEFQQNHLNLKDSIYNSDMVSKISEMQTKYETEKKEKEIGILTRDNEIKSLKIKRKSNQVYILFITIGLIILSILVIVLILNRKRLKQIQLRTELERKNLETEQRLLRSQMNPHFIFNSMNSIQSYISGNDSFIAMTYLSKFAKLMRFILENSRKTMICLADEIETLDLYIELEKIRFKDMFDFEILLSDDIKSEAIYVPPMLIQPFVENSIKHGFKNKDGAGKLYIEFYKKNDSLSCLVQDNGIGREQSEAIKNKDSFSKDRNHKNHQSLGMTVTHERLSMLSKSRNIDFKFKVIDLIDENGKPMGTKVLIDLPFETE